MAAFDPYLHWLSIRDPERPPNYYRLLGVVLFEDDREVLANAVDRQVSHVRKFQQGEYAAAARQLLDELQAAEECLLDAGKKAAYDAQLRASNDSDKSWSETSRRPPPPLSMVQDPAMFVNVSQLPRARAAARRGFPAAAFFVMLLGASVVLLAVAFWYFRGYEKNREPEIAWSGPITPHAGPQVPNPRPEIRPSPSAAETSPGVRTDETSKSGQEASPAEEDAASASDASQSHRTPEAPRYRVPSEAEQAAALKAIREVFAARYAAAKERDDKRSLARALLQHATETRDDPVARFVLYGEVRDLALAAGDTKLLVSVLTLMGSEYELDWRAMATESLLTAAKQSRDIVSNQSLGRLMLEMARGAMERENYEQAKQLIETGAEVSRKSLDQTAVKQFVLLANDVDERIQAAARFADIEKTLISKPRDVEANRIAAKYYCLVKNDWPRGLERLLNVGDAALKKPIEVDLAAESPTAADMIALGDLWLAAAASSAEANRRLARLRAVYWYEQALPGLTGFTRKKIERQLNDLLE